MERWSKTDAAVENKPGLTFLTNKKMHLVSANVDKHSKKQKKKLSQEVSVSSLPANNFGSFLGVFFSQRGAFISGLGRGLTENLIRYVLRPHKFWVHNELKVLAASALSNLVL